MTDLRAKPRLTGVTSSVVRLFSDGSEAYFLACVLLFAHITLTSRCAMAQTQPWPSLQVDHDFWGFKDNAPQGTQAFAQTNDGFLWVGTPTGLYRFDGNRFELFHSTFGQQLLSTNISALFAPLSGGLWIGYAFGGFTFLLDGSITNYSPQIAASTGSVVNFAQNAHGVLWAATTSGLWKFDHSEWQHIGPDSRVPAGSIREAGFDQSGTLWILTGGTTSVAGELTTLVCLQPGRSQFQTLANNLKVLGFTVDADGRVVTSGRSKQRFGNTVSDPDDLPSSYPVLRNGSEQIVDRSGNVWILPSEPKVLRAAALEVETDALDKASPHNSETYDVNPNSSGAKLVDREGNIWFGQQNGVYRFFYSPLFKQELPKNEGAYFTLAAADHGAVWITAGGDNVKLFRVANGQIESRKFEGNGEVQFAYGSPDKTVWFGRADGLWRLVNGNAIRVHLPKEMADQSPFLQAITEDRQQGMWVSFGRHGLYRLADNIWTPARGDLPKAGVVVEFTDSLGRVWFGYTKSQLAVLDADHVRVFGPADGIRVGNITAVYGRGSEIWIGGEFGLQQFDHGRFHNIETTDDELLRGISGIVETTNGDLWLNGLGGIFHVRRSEIAKALKNSAYQVRGEHFGLREGLPGFPFQLRPLNTAIEGTDGRLWFATSGGVVWLDPARPEMNAPSPPVTIQSVSADDNSYPLGAAVKFQAHTSSVQISYAAISLSDTTAIRFRYKLQENDKEWHQVSSASPVSYRNLAPGSYHFKVMATDTNGVWSDKTATVVFSISPAFYQTRWFLALCVAASLTALYLLYLLRLRQVAHLFQARMDERVDERTRIARELHDTLLQSLQAVLLLLHHASDALPVISDNDAARDRLSRVIGLAARAVTEGRDAVQGLRSSTTPNTDFVSALNTLAAELAAVGANQNPPAFRVEANGTPRNLNPALRDEIYRIACEALRNAFHHANAQNVRVAVRYDRRRLTVLVRDDGQGISPEILEAKGRAGHWGLAGMRERASKMGAQFDVKSGTGAGTEVKLTVPAAAAYQSRRARENWFPTRPSPDSDS
jgi:signal transduction histidine kinase/ligand-binding sensor domain-containing protein